MAETHTAVPLVRVEYSTGTEFAFYFNLFCAVFYCLLRL